MESLNRQQNRFWKKLQEGRLAKIDNLNLDKITLTVCDTEAVIPTIIFKDCTILLSYQHLHHHHIFLMIIVIVIFITLIVIIIKSQLPGRQKLAAFRRMKNGHKIFDRRVVAIFATNSSFLCIIANLQMQFSLICTIYPVIVHFLPKKH